jgi:hypothetical protein
MLISPLVIDADVPLQGPESPFPRPAPRPMEKRPLKRQQKSCRNPAFFRLRYLYEVVHGMGFDCLK